MDNPKIMLYYHHYGGLGHGTRILAVIKSIRKSLPGAKILVVNSGLPQDFLKMDRFAKIIQLSPLVSDKGLFYGIKSNSKENLESIMKKRGSELLEIFSFFNPDFLFIEHYPFGRDDLAEEISSLIKHVKQCNPSVRIFSMVRDLLQQKINIEKLSERVKYFDALFLNSDPSIFRIEDEVNLPKRLTGKIVYSGYIALSKKEELMPRGNIRKQLAIDDDVKLIVANIGGGIDGYNILKTLISIKKDSDKEGEYVFLLSAGPSISNREYKEIDRLRKNEKDILLTRFNRNLLDYINAADLSISMAGYHACMNAIVTGIPTLLIPRNDAEQQERARKFSQIGYSRILYQNDMSKERLLKEIKETIKFKPLTQEIDMNGADFIARFIAEYGKLEYVKIRLLTKCNCNCDMCTWVLGDKGKEIPKDKVLELYSQFKILGVKHINFTGGEPTLRKDITELIKKGKQNGFKVSISTNGNFDESFAKKLVQAGIDMIDVSIDSADSKIHDNIRGKGVWKKAISNMSAISNTSKEVLILINFTIRKDNYKEAEKMIEVAKKCGAKKLSFSMIYTEDNPKKEIKKLEMNEQELEEFYLDIVPIILKKAAKYGIDVKFSPYFKELENLPYMSQALKILLNPEKFDRIIKERLIDKKPAKRGEICSEIQEKTRIDNLGNISLCCTLDEDAKDISVGNIFKDNFVNIWLSDRYHKLRNATSPSQKCFLCKIDSANFKTF